MRFEIVIKFACAMMLCISCASITSAITIDVRYPAGTLFSSSADPAAKAAINAAAADLGAAITSSLGAVNTDTYSGVSGSATVTFNWNADYQHPVTGQSFSVPNATLAADTVTVFVGTANLAGLAGQSSEALAQGGPHIGISSPQVIYNPSQPGQWPAAAAAGASQSEAAYLRGSGPTIGTLMGGGTIAGVSGNYSASYGATFGSAWFDVDQDNNGVRDSDNSLDSYWHWNHNANVAGGKNDLYSVALHEFLHVLGIGSSHSWDALTNGTSWSGSEVSAITGSNANLIDADDSHIARNVFSTRISDGSAQEVVMDPNLTQGQRKSLTVLDLAFLRDLGYETVTPTLPADYNGDGDVDGADLATLENWYGINANGDTDGDGDTDGTDYLNWQRAYTGQGGVISLVPEPSTVTLLLLTVAAFSFCGRFKLAGQN